MRVHSSEAGRTSRRCIASRPDRMTGNTKTRRALFVFLICAKHICVFEPRPRPNQRNVIAAQLTRPPKKKRTKSRAQVINEKSSIFCVLCYKYLECVHRIFARHLCCWLRTTLKMPSGRHFRLDCISLKSSGYCVRSAVYVWCYWYFWYLYMTAEEPWCAAGKKPALPHWPKNNNHKQRDKMFITIWRRWRILAAKWNG